MSRHKDAVQTTARMSSDDFDTAGEDVVKALN